MEKKLGTEEEIHRILSSNKNTKIEIWYNPDVIVVHYIGRRGYVLLAQPHDTYLFHAHTPEVQEIIKARRPDEVIKGREKCREFQNFMEVMVNILPDNASIFVGKIA